METRVSNLQHHFKWISGECNMAANCFSCLVELPQGTYVQINLLSVTTTDGPTFNTRNQTHQFLSLDTSTSQPDIILQVPEVTDPTPKSLTADRLEALLQMQNIDPFCKRISKCLLNGNVPQHEMDPFTHVKGLLYKHITDSSQKFFDLVIPKSWKYTVLVEAHDKLGHRTTPHTYCPIKCQYYWKGMNKNIRKYIAKCTLCHRKKANVLAYQLQMTEILDRPFHKNAIDLVTECETSN